MAAADAAALASSRERRGATEISDFIEVREACRWYWEGDVRFGWTQRTTRATYYAFVDVVATPHRKNGDMDSHVIFAREFSLKRDAMAASKHWLAVFRETGEVPS